MDKTKHLETKYSIIRFALIKKCSGDELRWYSYVKLYAINKHSAFPSFKSFKRDLGWSRYSVNRIIKSMEKKKRLKVIRSKGRNNIYDIIWYDNVNNKGIKCEGFSESRRETSPTSRRETSPLTIRKKTINKNSSLKELKPFFKREEMRKSRGKWWVIPREGGQWLEFAGQEKEIEWK